MKRRPVLPNQAPQYSPQPSDPVSAAGSTPSSAEGDSPAVASEAQAFSKSASSTPTSATRAFAGRRPSKPATSAPGGAGRWLRGIHFSAFSLVMMGILVLAVVMLAPTLRALVQQKQEIADQQAIVNGLTAQVDAAKAQRARWNDPSYIRAQARDRLYYVMPGETSYLVIDDRLPAASAADAPVSSKLQQTRTDWMASLFGSFMAAGLTEATPGQLNGDAGSTNGTDTPPPAPTSTE